MISATEAELLSSEKGRKEFLSETADEVCGGFHISLQDSGAVTSLLPVVWMHFFAEADRILRKFFVKFEILHLAK